MGDKSQKDKNKVRKQKAVKVAEEERTKQDKQEVAKFDSPKAERASPKAHT